MPIQRNDSLAVVRLVRPIQELQSSGTAVFVGKGLGRITSSEHNIVLPNDARTATESALAAFIKNGYKLENSTEHIDDGLQISTFYLKKRTT